MPDARAVLADLRRRLFTLLLLGTVSEVDLERPRIRVEYDRDGQTPVVTDWLPWLTDPDEWKPPPVGVQAAVFCPDGDPRRGFVLGLLYSAAHPSPSSEGDIHLRTYPDGARIAYDAAEHELRVELPAGGSAALTAPGGVTVTGNLTVDGDIKGKSVADGDGDLAEIRGVYNRHVHTTPPAGVPPGSPVEKMR